MNAKTNPVHSSDTSRAKSPDSVLNTYADSNPGSLSLPSGGSGIVASGDGVSDDTPLCREGLLKQFDSLFECAAALPKDALREVVISLGQRLMNIDQQLREVPPLPERYQLYSDTSQDPYDWLGRHWGRWLKHFTPSLSRDYLFLDQLGELDPALKRALYAKRRSILNRTHLKISQIIPKKSVRLDYQIQEADPDALKAAVRTYALPKVRKSRGQHGYR